MNWAEKQRIIETFVAKRDEREDGFAKAMQKAMQHRAATDSDETTKFLTQHAIARTFVKKAVMKIAESGNPFTIWTLAGVDASFSRCLRRESLSDSKCDPRSDSVALPTIPFSAAVSTSLIER